MKIAIALLMLAVVCPLIEDVPANSIGGKPGRGCHYSNSNGGDFWVWIPGFPGHPELPACADPGVFN